MIPKVIHYCWFGKNPLPELAIKCISSWKKYCPDYELKLWNEDSFDVTSIKFTEEAYKERKWAFITDYVRLYVMHNYGGVYLDTDVELLSSLDPFLNNNAFSGFETKTAVTTGIMASEKDSPIIYEMLKYYDSKSFYKIDGSIDDITNVVIITKILKSKGLKLNNTMQTIDGFTLYPKNVFCPKDYKTGEVVLTKDTVALHHFNGTWKSDVQRKEQEIMRIVVKRYGKIVGGFMYRGYFIFTHIQRDGIKSFLLELYYKVKKRR